MRAGEFPETRVQEVSFLGVVFTATKGFCFWPMYPSVHPSKYTEAILTPALGHTPYKDQLCVRLTENLVFPVVTKTNIGPLAP